MENVSASGEKAQQRLFAKKSKLVALYRAGFPAELSEDSNAMSRTSNIQTSHGSIFICYRCEGSADVTHRIYDRLVDHFGPDHVFML